MSDRLNTKHEAYEFDEDLMEKPRIEKLDRIKMERSERSERTEKHPCTDERFIKIKIEKDIKQEDGYSSDKNEKSEKSETSDK